MPCPFQLLHTPKSAAMRLAQLGQSVCSCGGCPAVWGCLLLLWSAVATVWAQQQLIVADVNPTLFPQITMQLFSFDAEGKPSPLDPLQDRLVTERMGVVRQTIAAVTCPSDWEPVPVSAVLVFDWASPLVRSVAADALRWWSEAVPSGSQVGAVAFGYRAYIIGDLQRQLDQITAQMGMLPPVDVALPLAGVLDSLLGGIAIVARGSQQRCVVVVTEHPFPSTVSSQLGAALREAGSRLVVLGIGHRIPAWLRRVCAETGGIAFDMVSPDRLPRAIHQAAAIATGYAPCTISWQSIHDCVGTRLVEFLAPSIGTSVEFTYSLGSDQLPMLDVLPRYRNLGSLPPGLSPPQDVVLTAQNADLTLLAITADPSVEIVEGGLSAPLLLRQGQTYRVRVQLRVDSSRRTVGALRVVSTACSYLDMALLAANVQQYAPADAQFVNPASPMTAAYAGVPFDVEWTGTLPSDSLTLQVQQFGETQWTTLAEHLVSTRYRWQLPLQGQYRFRLVNKARTLQTESGIVQVVEPPFGVVPLPIQSARAGTAVEFRPPHLICSDTAVALPIDSVRFVVGRAFALAQSLPDTLPPFGCISGLLRFAPPSVGLYQDTMVVYTPVGMRRLPLAGNATPPIMSLPATIRLGTLPLGAQLDTLVQWLVCVSHPQQVRLRLAGPDSMQLQLRTIREFSLTDETPCLAYPFRVRGEQLGRTCLRLLIEGDERQPYETVLIADVVCRLPYDGAVLSVPQGIVTQAGRVITVPVWLPSVPQTFRSMQRPFRFTVRCNASTLLPEPPLERGIISDGERRFVVSGRGFLRGDTLALLRFGTYWGDAPVVQIAIEDFQWLDQCPVGFPPVTLPVLFTDYCTAGGTTRLFLNNAPATIERVEPQPSTGRLRVSIRTEHVAPVELLCYDMLGELRWSAQLGTITGTVDYELDLPLPTGQYLLHARSPAGLSSTVILLAR